MKVKEHYLYNAYKGMRNRCSNENHASYKDYGARGITVCTRWLAAKGQGFWNFLSDMGDRPEGCTLDRRDNDKGYSPDNCFWATRAEQNTNKRSNRLIELGSVSKTLSEWAELSGNHRELIAARLDRLGWDTYNAIYKPADQSGIFR